MGGRKEGLSHSLSYHQLSGLVNWQAVFHEGTATPLITLEAPMVTPNKSQIPAPQFPSAHPPAPAPQPTSPSTPGSSGESQPPLTSSLPLRSPEAVDLEKFNALVGDWAGKPVEDIRRLFFKRVILDDQTTVDVETIKSPGFIGISDAVQVTDAQGRAVSGHEDIVQFLAQYGLLISTYQWNKDRYDEPFDTRRPLEGELFVEGFIKNEGHHAGAVVPAVRLDPTGNRTPAYGTFNEPNHYHKGLYGSDGYVAVTQRLVFPEFVTSQQARSYTNSIICWMGLLNPFVEFPDNYNGGDPTHISDRATLTEFLKNGLLAALGDLQASSFFKNPLNKCYCAEFMYVCLNTPIYPFNRQGLLPLLGGNAQAVDRILAIQAQQNQRQANVLSQHTGNLEFAACNIPMPLVDDNLPALDVLMTCNGYSIDPNSLPFPPFRISQIIRRAFRTLLPYHLNVERAKINQARARLLRNMESVLLQQLGLNKADPGDPKVLAVQQFIDQTISTLNQPFSSEAEFEAAVDRLMAQADVVLVGEGDRSRFVPPRIYVDLGQNDGDDNLPQGWGFRLETVGTLIGRSVIR